MYSVIENILPIFLITLSGAVIKNKWITSNEFWSNLEKLSFYFLFPLVLFNYISSVDLGKFELTRLVIALMISTGIVAFYMMFLQSKNDIEPKTFTSMFQGATRYNSYIFFGLSEAMLGEDSLGMVSVVSAYMIVFTNMISVSSFARYMPQHRLPRKRDNIKIFLKLIFTNPLIFGSLAGFLFNKLPISLNMGLEKTLHSVSGAAMPIGLINIGASLKFNIKQEHIDPILRSAGVKLLLLPLVGFVVLSTFGVSAGVKDVGILYTCLPCASSSYILSRHLGGDHVLMASIITFSTILSVFTISFMTYILA